MGHSARRMQSVEDGQRPADNDEFLLLFFQTEIEKATNRGNEDTSTKVLAEEEDLGRDLEALDLLCGNGETSTCIGR